MIRRRQFISLLGGAAAAPLLWPRVARAQQGERMRRVGILMGSAVANSPESQASMAAFLQGLAQLGWTEGRNLRIDSFSAVGNPDKVSEYAAELATLAPALAALAPDVILTNGTRTMEAMSRATRTVPIVFVNVTDPVSAGFVNGLARPGGNATGFTNFQNSIASKWLELLKEIAPRATRVGILRDPAITAGVEQWAVIHAAAPSLGMEVIQANLGHEPEIVRAFAAFARSSNSGLIVTTSTFATVHRKLIITLAAQHKLPAVYSRRLFVADGGLISYGADLIDQYRLAAGYVDRILRGEKPADLPVQAPTRYELVINLKTAKALGLTLPPPVLARADEVIE
jgi:putative ABC transport system substrate-binding protein